MTHKPHSCLTVAIVALMGTCTAQAATVTCCGVATDLWNYNVSGTTITNRSALLSGTGRELFGDNTGALAFHTLLFADGRPAGTVHFVEWQTAAPLTIGSFHLSAMHDQHLGGRAFGGRDANFRGIRQFRLYAYNSISGFFDILLYDFLAPIGNDNDDHPGENAPLYDPDGVHGPDKNLLSELFNVNQVVTTNRWRAEFIQYGPATCCESGPRLLELDGFAVPAAVIPEPATFLLCGAGLLAAGMIRRRGVRRG